MELRNISIGIAAILTLGLTNAFATGILYLPTTPISATHGPWNIGPNSTIEITLSSVPSAPPPGYDVTNGIYDGWCLEENHQSDPPPGSLLNLLDSTDSVPLSCDPGGFPGVPWDEINYLLNHKQGATGTIPATIEDIQVAIWIVAGTHDPFLPTFPVTHEATTLAADAQSHGTGFIPAVGELVAVVLCSDGIGPNPYQDTIIEVVHLVSDVIFFDGFESGDTQYWTAVAP